jgi:hypothetical protein
MAIEPGCQYGLAGIGGRPKQCKTLPVAEVRVKAGDKISSELMPCCDEHSQLLRDRHYGVIYREVEGVPTPVRIRRVDTLP